MHLTCRCIRPGIVQQRSGGLSRGSLDSSFDPYGLQCRERIELWADDLEFSRESVHGGFEQRNMTQSRRNRGTVYGGR